MTYRIALAGFIHETNTYSPLPTGFEQFSVVAGSLPGLVRGAPILKFFEGRRLNLGSSGFINSAAAHQMEIVPLVYCAAEPSGTVSATAFERILALICAALSDNMPVDGVFLDLHGAMVYEGAHDGETEIIRRVRAIVGDRPVVASYDLHGNITPEACALASAMVGCRTYPHVDFYETGERCAGLMAHMLAGKPLFKAFRQPPYLMPISCQSTNTEPARSMYAKIEQAEAIAGVCSATIMMGFPPADIVDTGPSIFTYAESQKAADQAAELLLAATLEAESGFVAHLFNAKDAVKKASQLAQSATKPVILADTQDNAGGGATSDTVWILDELVKQEARDAVIGLLFDPASAAAAHAAGEGAEVTLDLGGHLMPGQKPYHAKFKVEKLFSGEFTATGPMLKGLKMDLGKMALVSTGGVRVAVSSVRVQANDQALFRVLGVEPAQVKILVLKSANHYRADFEPICSVILPVAAPGAIVEDPAQVEYKHLRKGVRLGGLGPQH